MEDGEKEETQKDKMAENNSKEKEEMENEAKLGVK